MTFTQGLGVAGVVLLVVGLHGLWFSLEGRFKARAGMSSRRYLRDFIRDYRAWRRRQRK